MLMVFTLTSFANVNGFLNVIFNSYHIYTYLYILQWTIGEQCVAFAGTLDRRVEGKKLLIHFDCTWEKNHGPILCKTWMKLIMFCVEEKLMWCKNLKKTFNFFFNFQLYFRVISTSYLRQNSLTLTACIDTKFRSRNKWRVLTGSSFRTKDGAFLVDLMKAKSTAAWHQHAKELTIWRGSDISGQIDECSDH
jgi:hypothetical protein